MIAQNKSKLDPERFQAYSLFPLLAQQRDILNACMMFAIKILAAQSVIAVFRIQSGLMHACVRKLKELLL